MECQMCKKMLSKRGPHFICNGPCGGTFHRGCVKGLTADLKAGRNRLRCNNCEDVDGSEDDIEEEEPNINGILKDIQKKVSSLPALKKQLESIEESMSVLSDKYDTLLAEHEQSKQKINKLEKSVLTTANKCVYLEKCNIALEQKLNEFEQASRKNNIEVVGVEKITNENVMSFVTKIGELMNVKCDDIESAKRAWVPSKSNSRPAPIIVEFKCNGFESRNKWLSQRRKLTEINSSMITGGSLKNRIFINEDLTKSARFLLWSVKKQLRGVYKYIWVANGKILVKKTDGDKSIWVRSESEVNELLKVK